MRKGYFITFEGAEGSGKSTQVELLVKYLQKKKIPFITTREPGGTEIGEQIREILLNPKNSNMSHLTELLLYSASRSQHVFQKIVPAVDDGKIVISDRFSFASLAYQGYGRGIELDLINNLTKIATQGLNPDLIFLLDINPEVGLAKAKIKSNALYNTENGDRLEKEDLSFHNRVREGYLKLSQTHKNVRLIEYDKIEIVHSKIINIFESEILT
ncbi:MAG TPA: dTMP kinase [bacterium]|nr:dTMP kinase [bacterium]